MTTPENLESVECSILPWLVVNSTGQNDSPADYVTALELSDGGFSRARSVAEIRPQ